MVASDGHKLEETSGMFAIRFYLLYNFKKVYKMHEDKTLASIEINTNNIALFVCAKTIDLQVMCTI